MKNVHTLQADSLLFDLDGTLWDSVDQVVLTWNTVISRYPGLRDPITRQEQESLMGLQMDEIARRLFPRETSERQALLMDACVQAENAYLRKHGANLYPALQETLDVLHRRYPLYIVSNCQSGYIEAFLAAHRLEPFFSGFSCFGDTGYSKGENIRLLVAQQGLQYPWYVGDTQGDLEAARYAEVPFVYAAYGFGCANCADARIQTFSDLLQLFSS